MTSKTISIKTPKRSSSYQIEIGTGLLSNIGDVVRRTLGSQARRVAVVSNPKVFGLYGSLVADSLDRCGFQSFFWNMKDGEQHKNLGSLGSALRFLGESRLKRTDVVIALGGGVVGDLAGFAASIYLRGIPFFQVPTTLLSMIDSSVGGKTGVNTEFGKNLVGAFYQPRGVIADVETLATLPDRELTAGFCEAVKQGALSGNQLLDRTGNFLARHRKTKVNGWFSDPSAEGSLVRLIHDQIAFKAGIVRQDETESLDRSDSRSRKILNFGHTFGHALEKVTEYKRFKHGEAVGHGILFAAELSKILELADENGLKCLNDVVHRAGTLPPLQDIDRGAVLQAFQFDKKLISESLQWILLRGIGKPVILSGKQVPSAAVRKALKRIIQQIPDHIV